MSHDLAVDDDVSAEFAFFSCNGLKQKNPLSADLMVKHEQFRKCISTFSNVEVIPHTNIPSVFCPTAPSIKIQEHVHLLVVRF